MADGCKFKERFNVYFSAAEEKRLLDLENELARLEAYKSLENDFDCIYKKIRAIDSQLAGRLEDMIYMLADACKYFYYRNGFADGSDLKEILGGKYNTVSELHTEGEAGA